MPARVLLTTVLLITAISLCACTQATTVPVGDPPSTVSDVTGTWYRVEGEHATVLELAPDGTGMTYAATVGALRGQQPGMGIPRGFRYTVEGGVISLDFVRETDVELDVTAASPESLIVEGSESGEWAGSWTSDFK